MADWTFYGRKEQLADLERMLGRKRWFFAKVTGRRRIGKTALIQKATQEIGSKQPVFYVQVPDSEPTGVLSAVNDAFEEHSRCRTTDTLDRPIYFNSRSCLREWLRERLPTLSLMNSSISTARDTRSFCSYLQARVDRNGCQGPDQVGGGLFVLGSIHTEMMALLEDRTAPLYNRVTNTIDLTHLDIGSVLSILREHAVATPDRLLFLWSLFEEGAEVLPRLHHPEQQVLGSERKALLRRIFFESSSPLRSEAVKLVSLRDSGVGTTWS